MNEKNGDAWKKKEIESHSSLLTNIRLDKFFYIAGELSASVSSTQPNPEMAMQYFAAIKTIFLQSHFVYSLDINNTIQEEIKNSMINSNIINSRFQLYNQYTPEDVINLIQLSDRIFYLMVQGLQNLRYF